MATDLLTATLIGGPTVLLELGGFRFLTDPTFDPPGSYQAKGIVLTKQNTLVLPLLPLTSVLLIWCS
jgi:L-ascorbate metabolism protein UlaG (beta-lactamase superfamily)